MDFLGDGKDGGNFDRFGGTSFMGFVMIFAAAWLVVFILYAMDKSLSVLENTFVYLMILALEINIS